MGFSGGSGVKNQPANAGDTESISLIPGSEGNGSPPWFYCLGNPMDRGDWWVTVHGSTKSQTSHTHTHTHTQKQASNASHMTGTFPWHSVTYLIITIL